MCKHVTLERVAVVSVVRADLDEEYVAPLLAAKRAARDKWMPEQYRLLHQEAAKRAKR